MSQMLWVAAVVLVVGLVMVVSGLAGGPVHPALSILVILLGVVLAVIGWRRRAA